MDLNALSMQTAREHDACGIFAQIEKTGEASYKPIRAGLEALHALRHRAGYVGGEGDGCGLSIDIPRALWKKRLTAVGKPESLAEDLGFFVGHLLVKSHQESALQQIAQTVTACGLVVHYLAEGDVVPSALGPSASTDTPLFMQVAGLLHGESDAPLFAAIQALEATNEVHVASLSRSGVVYKVVGDGDTLYAYYRDLQDTTCASRFVLAHTRYSTNTATTFARVQPFSVLGHNGEINTILRFYEEAHMIGIDVDANYSDSQMVNHVMQAFMMQHGWSLYEVVELLFPPILNEIKQMPKHLADLYMFYRALWGPFAQGPAGMILRYGKEAVFSVDALGLRPLWLVETQSAYCFSSEQGIVPPVLWTADPKPIGPGEKIGITMLETGVRLDTYAQLQDLVHARARATYPLSGEGRTIHFAGPFAENQDVVHPTRDKTSLAVRRAAFGWREEDVRTLEAQILSGNESIQSLGYDSPLAALDGQPHYVSDFLQESVAVVTNPAIDREREIEHFSTRAVIGKRPSLHGQYNPGPRVEVQAPILLEEVPAYTGVTKEEVRLVAQRHGTLCYEDVLAELHTTINGTVEILLHRLPDESMADALDRFSLAAREAVQAGANVIVLDDRLQFKRGASVDPFVALAVVHKSLLRPAGRQGADHIRRRSGIILRSGALRTLHDVAVALGLGADAVNPYLMWESAAASGSTQAVDNQYVALVKGLEKVISTLGIHESRGYERLFGAIGLHPEIADILGVPTFCASPQVGYGMAQITQDAIVRGDIYRSENERALARKKTFQLYPRIWKQAGLVAKGEVEGSAYLQRLAAFERENPINLRHALGFIEKNPGVTSMSVTTGEPVDTTVDGHAYPFVISSMSFGSQGETAYRAYAEAGAQLNIVALNGEGGEIKDMLEKYPRTRGRQIASGRFGVNAALCNNAYVLEIKIGQGAKPGEGGHLPGSKVTLQVAAARNASPGVDLISPSNNHDIYSIEDLAQVIFELKQINPYAKIGVKIPVVPNIGTIAVGVAKAGADIITLSGFDGGTGAARAHAIRHVGMPVEIGIKRAHEALCTAGLRTVVELWADGGMKSGADVMKAILLGANRVGFGTLAMVAVGCTACRACHKDTCHVGIATQMTDVEEAREKGVTTFVPREFEAAVADLKRLFRALGEQVAQLTWQLGATRTQDLVGQTHLLQQISSQHTLDLGELVAYNAHYAGVGTKIVSRPREIASVAAVAQSAVHFSTGTDGRPVQVVLKSPSGTLPAVSNLAPANTRGVSLLGAVPRALGVYDSGDIVRGTAPAGAHMHVVDGVAGNGFGAFHAVGQSATAYGGGQDGVGKGAFGGRIAILKYCGTDGVWRGGSVGKGLAYGAQHGLFIVQGDADARAGIRLSGADVIIGGEMRRVLPNSGSFVAADANIKGFAFEYMTAGRALVLGDPGPWICSGMTGGTVYLRLAPEMGLTDVALRKRIAKGAKVSLRYLDGSADNDVIELLTTYARELKKSGQHALAKALTPLIAKPADHFMMVKPGADITDQDIATE